MLHRRWVRWSYRGDAVRCPCCGHGWASFVPDWNRPGAICPGCGAHERHRALWLYLRDRVRIGEERLELLHFAPEYSLRSHLEGMHSLRYLTADLDPEGVDLGVDITAMQFPDESFDAIIASHVLEHVPDDRAAMSELKRVLRPGGWALVLVPLDQARGETYEDDSVTDPAERERLFWQHDHVRLYSLDVADRLRDAGFDVRVDRVVDALPPGSAERYGLQEDEVVFNCTRPPAGAA